MKGSTVNCRPSGPPPRSGGRAGTRGYAGPRPAPGRPARRARLSLSSPRRGGWCWHRGLWKAAGWGHQTPRLGKLMMGLNEGCPLYPALMLNTQLPGWRK